MGETERGSTATRAARDRAAGFAPRAETTIPLGTSSFARIGSAADEPRAADRLERRHRVHEPSGAVLIGAGARGTEVRARAEAVRAARRPGDAPSADRWAAARAAVETALTAVRVTPAGSHVASRARGARALPTVRIREGGHDVTPIGALVCATRTGLEGGLRRAGA